MSNIQSYNALIDRFHAFASGHFILKRFSHGQIEVSDLEKFGEYPFMHVIPSNVTYSQGMKTFSFQIVLADLPRDKDSKVEFQREVLSDLQRIAEDLIAEITNHRMLFGDLITVQNVTLEPFLEEFHNTLTGWTVNLELLVPYYWDACSIPAEWNDFFESGSGGTGSILTFIDSINRDENGNVSLVNDEETPEPNYYYGTNDEGVRGWYLTTDNIGLTCETIGDCQTIIDIEAAIDALEEEILLKADITSISAVGFSNDYNDLDNKPTIPTLTSDLTNDGADGVNPFITAQDLPSLTGYVPYTGATQDVDLGEFELKAGQVEFDQTPTGAAGVAVMRWNDSDGTLDLGLKGGNVTLQVGQESVLRVVNKTATNINLLEANYQAVRVTGAQGQRLKVDLALATSDPLSAETIGLVTETINNNQEGFITTSGLVRGINTTGSLQGETWADGDILYLSPTTAGRATKVKPTAPNHLIILGYVIHAHINQGSIFVKVDNGYELDELHNVKITTAANNNVLAYTSATDIWENKTVATALGFTPVPSTRSLTINGTTQDLSADRTFTISSSNIYNADGSLTGARTLTLNSFALTILGTTSSRFFANGNVGIGTTTDAGYKLDVSGSARANSIFFGAGLPSVLSADPTTALTNITTAGTSVRIGDNVGSTISGYQTYVTSPGIADRQYTSGEGGVMMLGSTLGFNRTFSPTSGTGVFNILRLSSTINQTGGASGITRGLYINPTLTAAANFRAIETTAGRIVISDTATVTGTNATSLLDLSQTWNTTGAPIALKVNITDTASASLSDLISLQVGGSVRFRVLKSGFFTFNTGGEIAGNLTIGGSTIDASSQLEVRSVTKGFLPPRMTTTQKNAIASPASGLVVYDTTLGKLCVRGAAAWETITSL
jgi:hypothetical protein